MNIQYMGDGFTINCQDANICIDNQIHPVRPRTFQLLMLLIKQQDTRVDKKTLLAEIWDDVEVDEQVIFQSVAEIRKIFGNRTVIQTTPRKGYQWVAYVAQNNSSVINPNIKLDVNTPIDEELNAHTVNHSTSQWQKSANLPKRLFIVVSLFLMITTILVMTYVNLINPAVLDRLDEVDPNIAEQEQHKDHHKKTLPTLFILPTKNTLMDKKFDWVSMGIMDTLISQAQDNSTVMPLDYVLLSMRNANMSRHYNTAQIARLFEITDASVVVESELTRTLTEYQLIYQIHQINDTKRGVIFNTNINDAVAELTKVIADIAEYKSFTPTISRSDFNHELFVESLVLAKQGKLDASIKLLETLIDLEPNNIQAYIVLIDRLQFLQDFEQALIYSHKLINIVKNHSSSQAGVYYRHAYNLFRLNKIEQAWVFAKRLNQRLKDKTNPYYNGFNHQLQGELYLTQKEFNKAKVAFNLALNQFKEISFSIGMTSVHCLLAKAESALGNGLASENQLNLARKVVNDYEIEPLLSLFKIDLKM